MISPASKDLLQLLCSCAPARACVRALTHDYTCLTLHVPESGCLLQTNDQVRLAAVLVCASESRALYRQRGRKQLLSQRSFSLCVATRPLATMLFFRIPLSSQDIETLSCAAHMVRLLFDTRFRLKVYQHCSVTGLKLSSTTKDFLCCTSHMARLLIGLKF